ncbi:hypothetical protein OIO90_000673 [Microbotryomycetes sp. JL221]|nr:hypothetical protein OIO90_000673 [Microbotryomycetes sp. JL221]
MLASSVKYPTPCRPRACHHDSSVAVAAASLPPARVGRLLRQLRASLKALDSSLTLNRNVRHQQQQQQALGIDRRAAMGSHQRRGSINTKSQRATWTHQLRRTTHNRRTKSHDRFDNHNHNNTLDDDGEWRGPADDCTSFGALKPRRRRQPIKPSKTYTTKTRQTTTTTTTPSRSTSPLEPATAQAGLASSRQPLPLARPRFVSIAPRQHVPVPGSRGAPGVSWLAYHESNVIRTHLNTATKQWQRWITRQLDFDQEVATRATAVIKTFQNILEACFDPSSSAGTAIDNHGHGNRRRLRSLVELMARDVGWHIETNVWETVHARDQLDDNKQDNHKCASNENACSEDQHQRKALLDEQEDAMELVDEWYSACPDYCNRWILADHAVSILVTELGDSMPVMFEWLLEICIAFDATHEAARLFQIMLDNCLREPPIKFNCHDLAIVANRINQQHSFFTHLEQVLLDSSFADRLFYSDFIDLFHSNIFDGNEIEFVEILIVKFNVARAMVCSIQDAMRNGTNRGGQRLIVEIIRKLEQQSNHQLIETLLTMNQQWFMTKSTLLNSFERLDQAIDEFLQELELSIDIVESKLPSLAFAIRIVLVTSVSTNLNDDVDNDWLSQLETLDTIAQEPDSDVTEYLQLVIPSISSYVVNRILTKLYDTGLFALERALLEFVISNYHELEDVRVTRGEAAVDKAIFVEKQDRALKKDKNAVNETKDRVVNQDSACDALDAERILYGTNDMLNLAATPLGRSTQQAKSIRVDTKTPSRRKLKTRSHRNPRTKPTKLKIREPQQTSEYEYLAPSDLSGAEEGDNQVDTLDSVRHERSPWSSLNTTHRFDLSDSLSSEHESVATSSDDDAQFRPELDDFDLLRSRSSLSFIDPSFRCSSQPTNGSPQEVVNGTKRKAQSLSPHKRTRVSRTVIESSEESADELAM